MVSLRTCVVLLAACAAAQPSHLSAQEDSGVAWQDGWISLSRTAPDFGWQQVGDAEWTRDGDSVVSDGREGWLFTTTEWADFELQVQFRPLDADANSGVFIRSALEPADPQQDCYEINIAPADDQYPTGSIVSRKQRARSTAESSGDDGFQSLRIIAQGGRIQVYVDDQLVADYTDPAPIAQGYIGLQSRQGRVEFRHVHLKPVGAQPIFNGKDLSGWNTDLAGPAEFTVTDAGELHVSGGSGQLESEGKYGDFVLQLDCKVNGDGLNSGVFFRCIPGERMNGYECQIHNGYKDGDRSKPVDCGTGGIYRRVDARRVVADDHEWFKITLHASGPHIAVWVNGEQVTDWTDTREPDENPRRGLRLAPGTFCLQAHDPTTDLLFRNFHLAELPKD